MNPQSNSHDDRCLPVVQIAEIPLEPQPRRWLVEGLWGASAVGLIGGPPKSCKSYLGLELAVAVASATPCLGRYPVLEPGPALVYLAEDGLPAVRERAAGLARHRAVDLRQLPLYVITAPRLRLDQLADCQRLLETVRRLRPRLLLLDPLVRLHAINENRAPEVAQLLSGLRELQRLLDVAIILVHHTRKNVAPGVQAGQGLRGSGDLHAFGDSYLYVRRVSGQLLMSMEHRAAAAPEPVGLQLVTADQQAIHLTVVQTTASNDQPRHRSLAEAILAALAERPAMTRQALRDHLAVKNQTLGAVLEHLLRQGRIERCSEGLRLSRTRGVPFPPLRDEGNGTPGQTRDLGGG
jgi:hypothetical protein